MKYNNKKVNYYAIYVRIFFYSVSFFDAGDTYYIY